LEGVEIGDKTYILVVLTVFNVDFGTLKKWKEE
jgi:hypothetical protein